MIPKKSIAIGFLGCAFLLKALIEWLSPTTNEVRFFLCLGFACGGLYIAYDQAHKKERLDVEINRDDDIRSIDKKVNDLENKFIGFKDER